VEEAILATLFVVEDEVECHFGAVGPADDWRRIGVAHDVSTTAVGGEAIVGVLGEWVGCCVVVVVVDLF
jgi:hypothetical protein